MLVAHRWRTQWKKILRHFPDEEADMSGRRAFGSIRKARSGRFEVRYTGPDGGKYTAGRSFIRKTDASAFLAHVEAEISEGTWISPKEARERDRAHEVAAERAAITFADWSDRWLASLERLGRTPKTIQTHTYRMRQLVPVFGVKPLGVISVEDVDTWYQRVWDVKGPGVVRPTYMTLSACMNAAVKSGLIAASPCKVPEGQKHHPVRERERQVATPEEVRSAADSMPARLRIAVLLAAWCQTRLGELTGLQRRDFDLDSAPATLRIERQVQYLTGEGPVELPPKSAAGVREIVIPASLVPAPLHPNSLRGAWERAREDAGIPWFKFHDLRHTGLTIFAQQGATLAELLHRGGHSDVDVALRYQHATRERDAALAARMDSHVLI